MILTVLVGSTNTRITGFQGRRIVCRRVVKSDSYLPRASRHLSGLSGVGAVALAAVRRGSLSATRKAVANLYRLPVYNVNHRTRTGLKIRYDRKQLGADRICAVVGARSRFPADDIIVLDAGTAVTVNVITAEGVLLGGAILPGQRLMLSGLSHTPARLPKPSPAARQSIIQHGTLQAMQAGVRHVLLGGLAGILSTVQEETGRRFGVVVTGGEADLLRGRIADLRAIDADLGARGLAVLWRINAVDRALPRPSQAVH